MSQAESNTQYCYRCGKVCRADDCYCPACGQKLHREVPGETAQSAAATLAETCAPAENPFREEMPMPERNAAQDAREVRFVPVEPAPARMEKSRSPMVGRILTVRFFRNAAILLLAAFLLVTAFLPIVRIDEYIDGYEFDGMYFRYSTVETMTLLVSHLHRYSREELMESRLYDAYAEAMDEAWSVLTGYDWHTRFDDLTPQQKRAFDRSLKAYICLSFSSEEAPFLPSILAGAVTSALYLVFAVAFFVVALLQFLLWLCRGRDLGGAAVRMLCAVPGAILALRVGFRLFVGNFAEAHFTGWVIAAGVGAVVLLAAVLVVGLATKELRLRVGSCARAGVTGVLALVMLCVLLLSPLSVKLTGRFRDTTYSGTPSESATTVTAPGGWDFFNEVSRAVGDAEEREEKLKYYLGQLEDYTRRDYRLGEEGAASSLDGAVTHVLLFATDDANDIAPIRFLPLLALFTAVAAGWLLMESLSYFVSGGVRRRSCAAARTVVFITALLLLAALIVTMIVTNMTIENTSEKSLATDEVFGSTVGERGALRHMMRMKLTTAPIFAAVLAFAALCIPSPGEKRKNAVTF